MSRANLIVFSSAASVGILTGTFSVIWSKLGGNSDPFYVRISRIPLTALAFGLANMTGYKLLNQYFNNVNGGYFSCVSLIGMCFGAYHALENKINKDEDSILSYYKNILHIPTCGLMFAMTIVGGYKYMQYFTF